MRDRLLRLLAIHPDPTLKRLVAALVVLASLTAWQEWGMTRLEPTPGAAVLRPLQEGPDGPARVESRPGAGRIDLAPGEAALSSPTATGTVALRITLPSGTPLAGVRVAAKVAAQDLRPAGNWSTGGHLRLVGRAADGKLLYHRELHLARLVGNRSPWLLARDVALPAGAVGATLVVELVRASGRLQVSELSLLPLRERPLFRLGRAALIAGWILVGGWTLVHLLRTLRSPWLAAAIGVAALVAIVLLVLPSGAEQRLVSELANLLGLEAFDPALLGNTAHVLVFAGLALLATAAVRHVSPWVVLATLALAAPLAEFVQLLTEGRDVEPSDAVRNLLGVAIGGGLGLLVRRLAPVRARLDRRPA
ncbi:MAG: hypothetical protein KatS3mg117_0745 [Geminicoccaceae bacterium]|nr:MAG: hypothetical protein KatS3mg117_0745 [Geminicoccaceae bacterium]